MKKVKEPPIEDDEMLPEYDFSGGVRGKYAGRFPKDAVAVVLDKDIAEASPDSRSVNRALRAILQAMPTVKSRTRRRGA
jgi:hypothetical protein